MHDVAIIGAGPAGISVALSLRDRGITALLIDRADAVGSSWRNRYDRLRLNTGRQFSHLPGRPFPKGTPTFPTRDQVVEHLETHVREGAVELRLDTTVQRIDRHDGAWRLRTSTGDIDASHVVVATGYMHTPHIPDWPGRDGFTGDLSHSSEYRNPTPYAGKQVMVIGSGSSGMEIAHDLTTSGAAKVWMTVRTPPNVILRGGPAGLPGDVIATPLYHAPPRVADAIARFGRRRLLGDLTEFGLPIPEEGPFSRLARIGLPPTLVDIDVIDAIRDGSIEIVGDVEAFDGDTVSLADGRRIRPDVVICATGYLPGLEDLVGHLGVLGERGMPVAKRGEPAADGLRFLGYLARPSLIGSVAKTSKRMAKQITDELSA
ncbi:NAD(P)/FAD-dependent oxidoreductase [Mycobacterium sp. AZCC_0083]|uniref:flavin-containing monooxygenase n=1 Tax=Mycobacterium sp. AZCC_0083 TaxID=2735882 RepID=UPI001607C2B1|nr:NAD(P)/FAD-dependent oxidoreductase [Mycobacterium sp. AZCC_0083]MBB5168580.1 NAD(P)H-nitrite reductase large subunit [Mycobacterium sp. AZCC_0083]